MIFVFTGAAWIVYELLAKRLGWVLISRFRGLARIVRDVWWLALGVHFLIESRRD